MPTEGIKGQNGCAELKEKREKEKRKGLVDYILWNAEDGVPILNPSVSVKTLPPPFDKGG